MSKIKSSIMPIRHHNAVKEAFDQSVPEKSVRQISEGGDDGNPSHLNSNIRLKCFNLWFKRHIREGVYNNNQLNHLNHKLYTLFDELDNNKIITLINHELALRDNGKAVNHE